MSSRPQTTEIVIPAQRAEAALDLAQSGLALPMVRPPAQVLEEAKLAAQALMNVIDAKDPKDKVMMNGKLYLEFPDWNTVARFFGVTAKTTATAFVDIGGAQGWEATAVAIRMSDGMVLGSADGMCLNDEENWGQRTVYDWQDDLDKDGKVQWIDRAGKKVPKRKRVEVGTAPTPQFQLRSMAQTRAKSKVLRDMFSWVIVLAANEGVKIGLTPAEEMNAGTHDGADVEEGRATVAQPQAAKPKGDPISEGQGKRMYALAKEAGYKGDDAEKRIHDIIGAYNFQHRAEVTKNLYEEICKAIQDPKWTPPAPKAAEPAPAATAGTPTPAPPKGFPVKGKVEEIAIDSDAKGKYMVIKATGLHIYTRDVFDLQKLEGATGQDVELICRPYGKKEEMKAVIERVVRVGNKEWMEDGTPVIRVDRGDDGPPTGAELFGDKK